jgi:mono/diheme cytochrome c family protein
MLEVPDFTDTKWWKEHARDKELVETISNGKGDMPDFGKKLTKPEIALLADYVRLFKKTEP